MKTISVDQLTARRFLLDTQHLLPFRDACIQEASDSETILQMIRKIECVQIDPVSVVERNQHLALAARIPEYKPEYLDQLLSQGKVFEYKANEACIIPVDDYPIFRPIRDRIWKQVQTPLEELDDVSKAVLKRLKDEGPLPSRAFKSENRVHGYWDNKIPKTKETSLALNLLLDAGIIRVVHRERTERFFDLTERSIPQKVLNEAETIKTSDARQALIEKYIRAYRLFDFRDPRFGWQRLPAAERREEINKRVENETLIPVEIENVERQYFIMPEDLENLEKISRTTCKEQAPMEGPIRFLPPLDNLLWRRERVADLFDFHYRWEIYTPRNKRHYGAYTMPILYGDRLIGRIDPRLNRNESQLVIQLLQLEPGVEFTQHLRNNMREALVSFAKFHQVTETIVERTIPSDLGF